MVTKCGILKWRENRYEKDLVVFAMGKKIGKSVFTTGVAATTLFSGLAGHKAQAEEIAQKDTADQQ